MKTIQLAKGKVAIVDDEDYPILSQVKWHTEKGVHTYYAKRHTSAETGRLTQYIHSAIMGNPPLGKIIDHIDGDGLNNQRSNLRFVTKRQNAQNLHIKKSSIYPGVSYQKSRGKWKANILIEGSPVYLGSYESEIEAFEVYCSTLKKIGDFLCVT